MATMLDGGLKEIYRRKQVKGLTQTIGTGFAIKERAGLYGNIVNTDKWQKACCRRKKHRIE